MPPQALCPVRLLRAPQGHLTPPCLGRHPTSLGRPCKLPGLPGPQGLPTAVPSPQFLGVCLGCSPWLGDSMHGRTSLLLHLSNDMGSCQVWGYCPEVSMSIPA